VGAFADLLAYPIVFSDGGLSRTRAVTSVCGHLKEGGEGRERRKGKRTGEEKEKEKEY